MTSQADADRFEHTISPEQIPSTLVGDPTIASPSNDWGERLYYHGQMAIRQARQQVEEPFTLECLTLYMNNECNLDCSYCHSAPSRSPAERLSLRDIVAAAEIVAADCRSSNHTFHVVLHGGGEPTLHLPQIGETLSTLETIAAAHDVPIFRYIATNGVVSEEKATWLARHFDLIGLSCDGPPDVQNRQRPQRDGRDTSAILERTAHVFREEGCPVHVRATVTPPGLPRQAESVEYFCQQLSPKEIHIEPVYAGVKSGEQPYFAHHHAEEFVAHFMAARKAASRYGVKLTTSGSRLASIHSAYCHVFRHVLNLLPGGVATACFKVSRAFHAGSRGVSIGAWQEANKRFAIDYRRVQTLRRQLSVTPNECVDCFNRFHCTKGCPDVCLLEATPQGFGETHPDFRCLMQRALSRAILLEAAENLWSPQTQGGRGTTAF